MEHSWVGHAVSGARIDVGERLKQAVITGRSGARWMESYALLSPGAPAQAPTGNFGRCQNDWNHYQLPQPRPVAQAVPLWQNASTMQHAAPNA